MVAVTLWGSLASAIGEKEQVEIEANTIGELFHKLERDYPAAQKFLDRGIAVSVNGVIYRDEWSTPLPKDSEVFLLPRLAGG